MLSVLANRTYRLLFAAQVVALLGTGLATVALGLLAWDIAGGQAGQVLGTALAIKMVAYVGLSPFAAALVERLPRRVVLITLNFVRAAVALALPFVTEVWQVYALIFLLQAASAGFTPAFQATIPVILPGEGDYTKALSLSRLAYDLESLLSPLLAALLLTVVSFPTLFYGTVAGFVASGILVASVALPASPKMPAKGGLGARASQGVRYFFHTPRLRGLLGLNMSVAAAGSMVIVNTVVLVQARLGLGESAVAVALGAFGAGSMVVALSLPALLHRTGDRPVMMAGAVLLTLGTALGPFAGSFPVLLALWLALGAGFSLVQTPIGRVLRHSTPEVDLPAIFAAQFALSHACWLLAYPLAGWLGVAAGLDWTFAVLAVLAGLGVIEAVRFWPASEETPVPHTHPDLPPDHQHFQEFGHHHHAHPVFYDDLHQAMLHAVRPEK